MVTKRFQTGHVRSREADAGTEAKYHCRQGALGKPSKACHGGCTKSCRIQIDAARINAVCETNKDGNEGRVSAVKDAVDPARFGVTETPFGPEGGEKGGKVHGPRHGKYLGGTYEDDKCNLTVHAQRDGTLKFNDSWLLSSTILF